MNRLALGTAQFGLIYGVANKIGQVTQNDTRNILELAATHSIKILDTAIAYGESESCLGEIGVEDFKVITKIPPVPEQCANISSWVRMQVHGSLKRLNLKKVHGLLLHKSGQLNSPKGGAIYNTLHELKKEGFIEKIGVSIYSPSELEDVFPIYSLDLVQAPFNLLDQRLLLSGWLDRLKEMDVEVHTRSTFLQGLLIMDQDEIPIKFSPWSEIWHKWHEWLTKNDINAIHAALAFSLSFPQIDQVILGVDSPSHLSEIVRFASLRLEKNLPNFQCNDLKLIDPTNWSSL